MDKYLCGGKKCWYANWNFEINSWLVLQTIRTLQITLRSFSSYGRNVMSLLHFVQMDKYEINSHEYNNAATVIIPFKWMSPWCYKMINSMIKKKKKMYGTMVGSMVELAWEVLQRFPSNPPPLPLPHSYAPAWLLESTRHACQNFTCSCSHSLMHASLQYKSWFKVTCIPCKYCLRW